MSHAYSEALSPYVVVNLPRCTEDNDFKWLYEFLESLKDGSYFSPMWGKGMVIFKPPKVLVCSNSAPDMKMWSGDRYDVVNVDSHD